MPQTQCQQVLILPLHLGRLKARKRGGRAAKRKMSLLGLPFSFPSFSLGSENRGWRRMLSKIILSSKEYDLVFCIIAPWLWEGLKNKGAVHIVKHRIFSNSLFLNLYHDARSLHKIFIFYLASFFMLQIHGFIKLEQVEQAYLLR